MSPGNYKKILCDIKQAGVYHVPQQGMAALLSAAQAAGFAAHHVDLSSVRDKTALFKRMAAALGFPSWFGHNWDALADCLSDLAWLPANGYVLLLEHCDGFRASHADDFDTSLQVFAAAADAWRAEDIPFWVLVDIHADYVADFPGPQ
ncbi:MAG: barstar family protein [Sulfuritalea sp.]|nr:barstar family protein [Sulfuritalea sp.]